MLLHNAKFMERSRHSVDVNTISTELESSKKLDVLMLDLRLLSWGAFSLKDIMTWLNALIAYFKCMRKPDNVDMLWGLTLSELYLT